MGWVSFHKDESLSVKDWFTNVYGWGDQWEVVDCAIVKFRTLYGAIRHKETGKVSAVIFLLNFSKTDYHNFAYKDMDETLGPYYHECPEKILKLLTPLEEGDSELARHWRSLCWANVEARKARPKVRDGVIVQFANKISFVNGVTADTFVYNSHLRSFTPLGHRGSYTITKWREREYKVITKDELAVVQ